VTAELDENTAVRLLLASETPDGRAEACERARVLAEGIDPVRRPLAALRARLLLGAALAATGRDREADAELAAARCEELGLTRLLLDATAGLRGGAR
jgi:hypothetical protein